MKKSLVNKREFIKTGLLASLGLLAGLKTPKLFGNNNPIKGSLLRNIDELWKWSIEAEYYIATPRGIKCQLCPQACILREGETGDCKTRINIENRLFSITYGNPCAVHIDPVEKKPLFHFLPTSLALSIATAGCNLACLNCQNWQISQSSPNDTRNYDLFPEDVVRKATEYNCNSIAYTYSDPVAFYEYTSDTAKIARETNIKNILVSAGYINEAPLRNWCKYIDAANIDLKSFSNDVYEMLNAGTLEPVLNTLKILRDEGVWLEITNLVVPDWTDNPDMIRDMCHWLAVNGFVNTPLHFSRFHPQYKLANLPATPVKVLTEAKNIAETEGLKYVYIGNVPGTGETTFCPQCHQIVIERKGFTVTKNNLEGNRCINCKTLIPGVWHQ